jgi:flagellar motility protein MotE (MotC chaperone)
MKFAIIGVLLLLIAGGVVAGLGFTGVVKIPGITPKKASAKKQPASQVAKAEPTKHDIAKKLAANTAKPKQAAKPAGKPAATQDPESDKKLQRLATMYEQLPADEAGPIFAKLPDALVEKLLRKMDDRQAAKVLLTLGTDRAAKLTLALAK